MGSKARFQEIAKDLFLISRPSGPWISFSWLLKRKAGNFLIACADVRDFMEEISSAGGIARVFLTDIHFASAWHGEVANHYKADLVCHETDVAKVKHKCKAKKLEVLGADDTIADDFKALHTPGHADGGLCYCWSNGKQTVMFTGDFLCQSKGEWIVFCGKAKAKIMAKSLDAVGRFDASMICPGVGDELGASHSKLRKGSLATITAQVRDRVLSKL